MHSQPVPQRPRQDVEQVAMHIPLEREPEDGGQGRAKRQRGRYITHAPRISVTFVPPRTLLLLLFQFVGLGDTQKFVKAVQPGKIVPFPAVEKASLPNIDIEKPQQPAARQL